MCVLVLYVTLWFCFNHFHPAAPQPCDKLVKGVTLVQLTFKLRNLWSWTRIRRKGMGT